MEKREGGRKFLFRSTLFWSTLRLEEKPEGFRACTRTIVGAPEREEGCRERWRRKEDWMALPANPSGP
jgi:hypothetical protein